MKASLSFFLILFFTAMSVFVQANDIDDTNTAQASSSQKNTVVDNKMDYCYKPSKLLFFSTAEYKKRYAEDMKEYQRCRKSFLEMQEHMAIMKEEAEKNARLARERFAEENFNIRNY